MVIILISTVIAVGIEIKKMFYPISDIGRFIINVSLLRGTRNG